MKIKAELENEMLLKAKQEIESVLSDIVSIDLSLTLSNYKELAENKEINTAYRELAMLRDKIKKEIKCYQ
jgi:hypothetical protein